jgi:hypothetical protein
MMTSHLILGKPFKRLAMRRHVVLPVATLLGLLLCFAPVALANGPYALESIDFMTSQQQATQAWSANATASHNGGLTSNRTDIILYTGGIVPYKTVYADDQKTVLEFDNVRAANTVKTNFVGNATGQLSHVIVQPLNDHQLRLVLRGQQLGAVSVGFKDPNTTQATSSGGGQPLQDGSQIQSSFGEGFAGTPTTETSPTQAPLSTLSLEDATNAAGLKPTNPFETNLAPTRSSASRSSKLAPPVAADTSFNPFSRKALGKLPHANPMATRQAKPSNTNPEGALGWMAHLPQWDLALIASVMPFALPVACLIGLLTCLSLFLRHKWLQLNQQAHVSQQLADGLPQHILNDGSRDGLLLDPIIDQPVPKKNTSMQSPIGLGGLLPTASYDAPLPMETQYKEERLYNPHEAELDWIAAQRAKLGLKASSKAPVGVAPSQQVAQRYAQYNQAPLPVGKPTAKTPISRAVMQEEIRRSSEIQRQSLPSLRPGGGAGTTPSSSAMKAPLTPSNTSPNSSDTAGRIFGRKPGAKKGATGIKPMADPLPNNNPEVLAFLNAMADKLDKRANSNPV